MGLSVQSLAGVGSGCPDLLVGSGGRDIWLVEVKDGAKSPSRQQLTPDEFAWHQAWRGRPVLIVRSLTDAVETFTRLLLMQEV